MEETKKDILSIISNLYFKYGIKSITMDDVAKELGMSKKTIYKYFKDKNEVVINVIQHISKKHVIFFNDLAKRNHNAIDELFEIQKMVSKIIEESNPSFEYDLKKYYTAVHNQVTKEKRKNMSIFFKANLNKGIKEGLYRNNLNIDTIVKIQLFRFENLHQTELFSEKELRSKAFFNEIFNYHLRGIASDEGNKYIIKKKIFNHE